MKKRLTKVLCALLTLCMLIGLTACSGGGSGDTDSTGTGSAGEAENTGESSTDGRSKTVTIALSENIIELDPHNGVTVINGAFNDMLFNALVRADHEGGYTPDLATEWETSEDGTEWTFHLREGVQFSNGEEFNADDVVCTYQRLIDDPTLAVASNNWGHLTGVEKVDDYTVKILLDQSIGTFMLAASQTYIIPNEAFEEMGTSLFYDQYMYGTGKWKMVEWVDGQYFNMVKNEYSWEENTSYFDEVNFRFVLEASTAINSHITGDVDAYIASGGISADMLSMYAGTEDQIEIIPVETSTIDYLQFQCEEGSPFADPDVRRAFSMAIDRQTIIDSVFGGGEIPIGIASEHTMGYDPELTSDYYTYDPEAAKALLETTSYNGEPIVISSNVATTNAEAMLLAISENVNAIGFNTSIEVVEGATLLEKRSTGDYDCFIVAAMSTGGDLFSFATFRIQNDAHHSNYVNDELNSLIEQASIDTDETVRDDLYRQANEIIVEECAPMIGVLTLEANEAITYGITGIELASDGFFLFKDIDYDPSLVK